uniref:Ornithine cyclodeaminase n=1 Tax=Rhizobium halophytocola TaxID=735519 RepID=A0ABS4E5N0_9HYPH|nr:ornithine cyclodeaminase family protein [Rhizobium halophytocola]MBP1853256.1 ornithine cyclodeaminase [Rhizobium halophytocola]
MPTILTDEDLDNDTAMGVALEAIDASLRVKAEGLLIAPPRHVVPFAPSGSLFLTIGGTGGDNGLAGFRAYTSFDQAKHDQVVAVWHTETGALQGLVLGRRLGELRTGAIGGIAIKLLAREDATTIGVIGGGRQAFMQIAAAKHLRPISAVKVYSRSAENRESFAEQVTAQFELPAEPAESAEEAVADADIVICGTTATSPVLEAAWLKPGTHVTSVGPKMAGASEIGTDLAGRARIIATDSVAQCHAYDKPFFLDGTPDADRLMELDRILVGESPRRESEEDITLFCSTGLAGTEVYVAARLLAALSGG